MSTEERIYTPNPVIVALLLVCIFGSFFAVGYMLMDWMRENEREELDSTIRRWERETKAKVAHELHETPPPATTVAPEVE